jgi:hypothetical protein
MVDSSQLMSGVRQPNRQMSPIRTIDDLYAAVDDLIAELNSINRSQLADVLHHRLHTVSWASGSELLEELRSLLTEAFRDDDAHLPFVAK